MENTTTTQINREEYKVARDTVWEQASLIGGGYDVADEVYPHRWRPISAWGAHGWDLGDWPYVMIFRRDQENCFELVYYVEGDVEQYKCPTEEIRDGIIDQFAFEHWKHQDETWVKKYATFEELPTVYRGPYSRSRHDEDANED